MKIIILIFVILAVILFAPTPYYQKSDAICSPCPPDGECGVCPRKGWKFGSSLFSQIKSRLLKSDNVGEVERSY